MWKQRILGLNWLARGLLALLFLTPGGCTSVPLAEVVEIREGDLVLRYDGLRDRVVYVGLSASSNLLEVRDLEVRPSAEGAYRFYGGGYTWIAPQSGWRDVGGELRDWPPDPAMDRGPSMVVERGLNWLEVVGPTTRAGLVQRKRITVLDDATIEIRHELKNVSAEAVSAAIWSTTAVPTGGVMAVRVVEVGLFDAGPGYRLNDPQAGALFGKVSRRVGRWLLIDTKFDEPISGMTTDSFKAFFERVEGTEIAIWSKGYWLVRSGELGDIFRTLGDVGESSVEVYANYGRKLFEAELLSSLQTIAPGGMLEFTERWQIVRSVDSADVGVLDDLVGE